MNIKISISSQQMPTDKLRPEYTRTDVLQKVASYIRDINSNMVDSYMQWQYLKKMYNVLSKKSKLNQAECDIMEILEPEIMKHAEYDSENAAQLDGINMFKHMKQDK